VTLPLVHHDVQNCHWAVPTLFMPHPIWLNAWDFPWCCWNNHDVRVLPTSASCHTCLNFRPRAETAAQGPDIRPEGAVWLRPGPIPEL